MRTLALLSAFLAIFAQKAFPQFPESFGKNKVHWNSFDWQIMIDSTRSRRIELYYYPEEERIARFAFSYASGVFDSLSVIFGSWKPDSAAVKEERIDSVFERLSPKRTMMLVLYASHEHFEETNLVQQFIPQEVAGFTELERARIAIPFNGDVADLKHVVCHEIVHFFQLQKIKINIRKPQVYPLWFTEGQAEALCSAQTSEDNMLLRDWVMNGGIPRLRDLEMSRDYISVYVLGAEFYHFLVDEFGQRRVTNLYDRYYYPEYADSLSIPPKLKTRKPKDFPSLFKYIFGEHLEEVEKRFRYKLENRWWPLLKDHKRIDMVAEPIRFKQSGISSPAVLGDTIFFLSWHGGTVSLYEAYTSEKRDTIFHSRVSVLSGFDGDIEFIPMNSRIDAKAGLVVFVARSKGRDVLHVWNNKKRKIVSTYRFYNIISMSSPALTSDGALIVFSGVSYSGQNDLYLLNRNTGELRKLTDDYYYEKDPDFSPDGRHIVFSSDYSFSDNAHASNIFVLDAQSHSVIRLTKGLWQDIHPRFSPDGETIIFSSDRDGFYNFYGVDLAGNEQRVSNYIEGAFYPAWVSQKQLIFVGFYKGTFRLYKQSITLTGVDSENLIPSVKLGTAKQQFLEHDSAISSSKYKTKFSLDIFAAAAGYAPAYAYSSSSVIFGLSDKMNDKAIIGGISSVNMGRFGINNMWATAAYINAKNRLQWNSGLAVVRGTFYDWWRRDEVFKERSETWWFEGAWSASVFDRIEFAAAFKHEEREQRIPSINFGSLTRNGLIVSQGINFVRDKTLYTILGPLAGYRFSVGGKTSVNTQGADVEKWSAHIDLRTYFRLKRFSTLAFRQSAYWSGGDLIEPIVLGGEINPTIRLYPRLAFVTSQAIILNQEFRFPLFYGIGLFTPIGLIMLPPVEAAPFLDMVNVSGPGNTKNTYGSYGVSFRFLLSPSLILSLDYGRQFALNEDNIKPRGFYREKHYTDNKFSISLTNVFRLP